jgi:hypothetical protein
MIKQMREQYGSERALRFAGFRALLSRSNLRRASLVHSYQPRSGLDTQRGVVRHLNSIKRATPTCKCCHKPPKEMKTIRVVRLVTVQDFYN